MKKDFYLTSTFRHEWNRVFNDRIGLILEARGLTAFLPHRDTDQTSSPRQRFEEDMAGLTSSKVVVAIAENESPNWGAEVGFAYGLGMPIVALLKKGHDIPLILSGMVTQRLEVDDLDDTECYVDTLVEMVRKHGF